MDTLGQTSGHAPRPATGLVVTVEILQGGKVVAQRSAELTIV